MRGNFYLYDKGTVKSNAHIAGNVVMMLQIIKIYILSHSLYINDRIWVIVRQSHLFVPWQLISDECTHSQKNKTVQTKATTHLISLWPSNLSLIGMPYSLPYQSLLLIPRPLFFFPHLCCFLFPSWPFPAPSLHFQAFSAAHKCAKVTTPSLPPVVVAFLYQPS